MSYLVHEKIIILWKENNSDMACGDTMGERTRGPQIYYIIFSGILHPILANSPNSSQRRKTPLRLHYKYC